MFAVTFAVAFAFRIRSSLRQNHTFPFRKGQAKKTKIIFPPGDSSTPQHHSPIRLHHSRHSRATIRQTI
jgi:hypothetical protein